MNKKFTKALAVLSVSAILGGNIAYAAEPKASKNETVYVSKEAGEIKDKTVSVWINKDEKAKLKDKSDLKDIKNLETDEKIEAKDGQIDIDGDVKDFYYQGKTDKDLPVDVEIKYQLDGKDITYKDLDGKSGKLKITISAHNKVKSSLKSGKIIYSPYLVASEMTFADDQVKNIKADSAKIIKDGKNQIVTGILTPGMRDNFDGILDGDKLDKFKDEIEIEMEVENFKPSEAYLVITNEIFQDDKTLSSLDDLDQGIGQLTANAGKLVDASAKLKDGSASLNQGLTDLAGGADKLANGSQRLKAGFDQMNGAFADLPAKIGPMQEAISALNNGGARLNAGLGQYTGGVAEINSNMTALLEGADGLNQGANDLDTGINELSQGLVSMKEKISEGSDGNDLAEFAKGIKTLKAGIDDFSQKINPMAESLNKLSAGLEEASKSQASLAGGLEKLNEASQNTPSSQGAIAGINEKAAALENQIASLEGKNLDGSLTGEIESLKAIQSGLYKDAANLSANAKVNAGIIDGLNQLSSSSNDLTGGLNKLNQGLAEMAGQVNASKEELNQASDALGAGFAKLDQGLEESDLMKLAEAFDQLDQGLSKLKAGSEKLAAGTSRNKEGVEKLAQALNLLDSKSEDLKTGSEQLAGGLSEFNERSKALKDLTSINDKALNPMAQGLNELNKGILDLRTGALKLKEGSDTYNAKYEEFDSGLRRYKAEGIDKLSAKTGDLDKAKEVLDQMSDLARKNNSISGTSDEFETRSRIIEKIR